MPTILSPEGFVKVKLSYLITVGMILASLSVGWGGYRAAFINQSTQIDEARKQISALKEDMDRMHSDFARLSQSMDDLKAELIYSQGETMNAVSRRPPASVTVNVPKK